MTPRIRLISTLLATAAAFQATQAIATPIDYNEVSLLLRAGQSESSIINDVSHRKLLRALTPQQENTLKAQGASNSLLQALHRPDVVMPAADAAAYETRIEQARKNPAPSRAVAQENSSSNHEFSNNVHIFNVAYGQPINLSQWGGLDYEIAFYSYRFAGEDHVEPAMIDNVRSVTEVSRPIRFTSEDEAFSRDFFLTNSVRNQRYQPYDTRIDHRDSRLNLNDTVSVRSNSASRRLTIDWQNPVYVQGQPYAFYPVYGAGDASLYFIGKATDRAARVAVITQR
jgi:hypothetical protein